MEKNIKGTNVPRLTNVTLRKTNAATRAVRTWFKAQGLAKILFGK